MTKGNKKVIAQNKKVYFDYHIEDEWEAGIVLTGSEIKSIRQGHISIKESFIFYNPQKKQLMLHNAHIKEFFEASYNNHETKQDRPLLLNRREMSKIIGFSKRTGYTVKPIEVYFKEHLIKVKVALCRGKKLYDKREDMKKKDAVMKMDKIKKRING